MIIKEIINGWAGKETRIYPFLSEDALTEKCGDDAEWKERVIASSANISVSHTHKLASINIGFSASVNAETIRQYIQGLQKTEEILQKL